MNFRFASYALALLLAACAAPPPPAPPTPSVPIPLTPPAEQATAPVVRRELSPTPAAPIPQSAPQGEAARPPVALPPVVLPADAIYVCVVDEQGVRRQTVIEFGPKVLALCKRHPEMGPCQYERNVCRAAGGRVFAASGQEITLATEADYDKKVLRVRFRAN